jgi:hypothetical protein
MPMQDKDESKPAKEPPPTTQRIPRLFQLIVTPPHLFADLKSYRQLLQEHHDALGLESTSEYTWPGGLVRMHRRSVVSLVSL